MSGTVERSAEWIYHGVWQVLAECFRVPQAPPSPPGPTAEFCRTFHPSRRYLAYLKFYFWIALAVIDLAILVGWILLCLWSPILGALLALPALVIAVVPDIVAYVAIHLHYDTMWYVITDRSLRARKGVWVIVEHTITFENVQNVYVQRGPVQQLFGIAEVVLETAGSAEGESQNPFAVGNKAFIEGVEDPDEIRALIMERVRVSRSAGLGDEQPPSTHAANSPQHVQLLRDIRDEVRLLH